jgi:hypothetical protein
MAFFSGLVFLVLTLWTTVLIGTRDKQLSMLMLSGFGLRVFAGVANDLVFRFYGYASENDWMLFERHAIAMYHAGLDSIFDSFATGRLFFGWYSGLVFLVFGVGSFIVVATNVALGTWAVYLTHKLSLELWCDRRVAWWCTLAAAGLPTLVLHSGSTSREPLIIALFLAGVLQLVRFIKLRRSRHLWAGLALLLVPCILHTAFTPYALAAAVVLAVPGLDRIFLGRNLPRLGIMYRFGPLLAIAGVAALVFVFNIGLDKARFMESGETLLQKIALLSVKDDLYERTAYLKPGEIGFSSPRDLLLSTPRRIILFLFTPYPSMVRQSADIVGFTVAGTYAVLVVLLILSLRELGQNPSARFCIWSVALLVLIFSFGTVNYGTASRHKTKMLPVLLATVMTPTVLRRRLRQSGSRVREGADDVFEIGSQGAVILSDK